MKIQSEIHSAPLLYTVKLIGNSMIRIDHPPPDPVLLENRVLDGPRHSQTHWVSLLMTYYVFMVIKNMFTGQTTAISIMSRSVTVCAMISTKDNNNL